ncbi:hypothetical protein [Pseudomonas yangonensis]|uniref:hypothetical protein n=1 Tax=Pseudomonas yangonensis TaxID=2579922 RepID=UPI00137B3F93|nr:hypothetical protein [Pseudomonas yangonensis]
MDAMAEYYSALERLSNNIPIRVPRGSRISKDTVALEAGRGRGSIKKSRPQFSDLIEAIGRASVKNKKISEKGDNSIIEEARKYRELYEAALIREVSLLVELTQVRAELARASSATIRIVK